MYSPFALSIPLFLDAPGPEFFLFSITKKLEYFVSYSLIISRLLSFDLSSINITS